MTARGTGAIWESVAEAHLQKSGLRTLARNFVCRLGEIDLVLSDRDCTVFVEVRFRHAAAHGDGAASVGAGKRAKLLRAAQVWLLAHPRRASQPCRSTWSVAAARRNNRSSTGSATRSRHAEK